MGKLAIKSRTSGPTKEELYGRLLEGLADTDIDRFNAYKRAMGADNVKLENYVEQSPAINVQRRGKWVEPDKGIDIYDFTTDMVPELPAIGGAAIGGATAGIQGAVGGATIGNLIKQKIAQKMGLRKGISEGEAKFEGAMELLGPIGAAIPTPNVMARTVFHGSPHIFDKFDMSKIGTGEGAQAYGHGLYFAEKPGVAKSYQDAFTRQKRMSKILEGTPTEQPTANGVPFSTLFKDISPLARAKVTNFITEANGDVALASRAFDDFIATQNPTPKGREALLEAQKAIKDLAGSNIYVKPREKAHLYTVDIPDEHIDRMLDWDKPLSEQSQISSHLDALQNSPNLPKGFGAEIARARSTKYFDGNDLYRELVKIMPNDKATAVMREAGIPGIKYLDGTSRTAGEGTRNFVLFDDSIPKILGRE